SPNQQDSALSSHRTKPRDSVFLCQGRIVHPPGGSITPQRPRHRRMPTARTTERPDSMLRQYRLFFVHGPARILFGRLMRLVGQHALLSPAASAAFLAPDFFDSGLFRRDMALL